MNKITRHCYRNKKTVYLKKFKFKSAGKMLELQTMRILE